MYTQILDPAGMLHLSALCAALPLATLFLLLGVLRTRAYVAALASLSIAVAVALLVYKMPTLQIVSSGTEGIVFGLFPICWLVINALWIYNLTVESGHFVILRNSFQSLSTDQRIQAILIAFCFGALLESLAGAGAPVAICAVMLIGLGFRPVVAATVCLVANTAPVAFAALALPITVLANVTGLPFSDLGAMVGRQTPVLACMVPLILVYMVDGKRGLKEMWMPALCAGISFSAAQFLASNYISVALTDIFATLAATLALLVTTNRMKVVIPSVRADETFVTPNASSKPRCEDIAKAYAPYAVVIIVFALAQISFVKNFLDSATQVIAWPGLNVTSPSGHPVAATNLKIEWLGAAGTLLFLCGVITAGLLRVSPSRAAALWLNTVIEMRSAILTIVSVLALAYVMNLGGLTSTLGVWMAGSGTFFAFLSPFIGWLGVAITGSDASANALFGTLQVTAANQAGLHPVVLAAANCAGGVLGKMLSPQTLAIAAVAVKMQGQEGMLFRKVFAWSIGLTTLMGILVYLQTTPILAWMVVQ
ncbi:L-lactate permease [Pseudomonas putida]|uniref:L-lactate permease n=1 Tax=Pseudomonas putida TaxID=303 RepID=UPI002363C9E0|nr:L-lactate permease [Pseudomonas putida]MDD2002095.1 L-lactate permease [Pseudomonas putida]